ncbi:putative GTPase activating protein [Trypanosoma cruzi]|nr:putative GTPase activating protein [Trypanosoma cruzi]
MLCRSFSYLPEDCSIRRCREYKGMSKVDFVADKPRPLEDFIAVTGLKFWHAKKCFERFGGYAPALASFAQSYPSLPKNYFDRRQVLRATKSRINKELELIYRRARWIRNQLGENVERVWAVYYTYPTLSTESRFAALPKKCLRNVRYREPSHFTGPFFEMPTFWEAEMGGEAFFIYFDKEVFERSRFALREKLEQWVSTAVLHRGAVRYLDAHDLDEKTVRLIINDANKTFVHPDHRNKFVAFLAAMYNELEIYEQSMSFLSGLFMLVLTEEETASVLRFLLNVKMPSHWSMDVVAFSSAAVLVENFLQVPFLEGKSVRTGEYANLHSRLQSIMNILCVNVVNVNELFGFLGLLIKENPTVSFSGNRVSL